MLYIGYLIILDGQNIKKSVSQIYNFEAVKLKYIPGGGATWGGGGGWQRRQGSMGLGCG